MASIPYGTPRQSGRTQFTVDQVVDAIVNGQPYCQVVGRYFSQMNDYGGIIHRIIDALEAVGVTVKHTRRYEYNCDGSMLTFHTPDSIQRYNRGMNLDRYDCQFWDHQALSLLELGL